MIFLQNSRLEAESVCQMTFAYFFDKVLVSALIFYLFLGAVYIPGYVKYV